LLQLTLPVIHSVVELDPNHCPADPFETAAGYIMDTLDNADAEVFEEHCLICCRCLAALEEAERYVHAMQIATQKAAAR
jgi:hypothetical protein